MNFIKRMLNDVLVKLFNTILFNEEDYLKKHCNQKITLRGVHVLECVNACKQNNENTMGNVATNLGVTAGTLTTLLKKLEKDNYIYRVQAKDDKRKIFIELTSLAKSVLEVHDKYHDNMINIITSNLGKKEEMALVDLLSKIKYYFTKQTK